MSNDSSFHGSVNLHHSMAKELIIDENKANSDYYDDNNNENKPNNNSLKKKENIKQNIKHNKTQKLNVPINRTKHKKKKHKLTKSMSYDTHSSQSKHKKTVKKSKESKFKQRRNSKDCLDITAISKLTTKSIEEWSISEVTEWVKLIDHGKYKEYAEKFEQKKIDGKKLYKMNRTMLQSIEINHPSARKAILAALQKLKAKVLYFNIFILALCLYDYNYYYIINNIQIRQTLRKEINIYAKKHDYDKKKHRKKKHHRRGMSTPNGQNLKQSKSEMYVVAIKKHKTGLSTMPGLIPSISAPIRKQVNL